MKELIVITLIGLFFGTFGTMIGGIIGVLLNNISNKYISVILSFASGLMLSIICFDLIPEAIKISNIFDIISGVLFGMIMIILCDISVNNKLSNKGNALFKTGIVVSIGIALHNLPEGLAIGSGFDASIKLGYSLAIAICLHDIPEGVSMAVPMKNGGMSKIKVLLCVLISGAATGVGAFLGAIIGEISESIIAFCLSVAAGAMLYIVSGELLPESSRLYSGKLSAIGNIVGFLIGLISNIYI